MTTGPAAAAAGNALLLFLFVCCVASTRGAVVSWIGPASGGAWGDAANWNSSAVPTIADTVYLVPADVNATGDMNITLNNNETFSVGTLYLATIDGIQLYGKQRVGIFGPGNLIVNDTLHCGGSFMHQLNVISKSYFASTAGKGFFGCYLADHVTLDIYQDGVILGMVVGDFVDINVNDGASLAIGGRGVLPSGTPGNLTVVITNRGSIQTAWASSIDLKLMGASIENYGNFSIFNGLNLGGGMTNYAGSWLVIDSETTTFNIYGPGLVIEQGATAVISTSLTGFGVNVVASVVNRGDLVIYACGTPVQFNSFVQGPQGSTRIVYHLPTSGWYYGLFVSYVTFPVTYPLICNISGSLTIDYIDDDFYVSSWPAFRSTLPVLLCSMQSANQSRISLSQLTLGQPAIGSIIPSSTSNYVGFIPIYNVTLGLTLGSATSLGETFIITTSISENSAPLSNVEVQVSLTGSKGGPYIPHDRVTTDLSGQARGYISFPMRASFVSFNLSAVVTDCANTNATTCGASISGSYRSSSNNSGDGSWFAEHWWVFVAVGVGAAAGGVSTLVAAYFWRLRRQRAESYVPVNGSSESWAYQQPPKQYSYI